MLKGFFKQASIVVILVGVGKLLGFFRDIVLSFKFGANQETDAYFIANNIPTLIFTPIMASFLLNVIPYLEKVKNSNDNIDKFISRLINFTVILSLVFTFIAFSSIDLVLDFIVSNSSSIERSLTQKIANILVFSFPFSTLSMLLAYISSTYGKIYSQHLIPVISNFVVIVGIFFFSNKYGIYSIAVFGVLAYIIQFFIQYRISKGSITYVRGAGIWDSNIKSMVIIAFPFLFSNGLEQINLIVNSSIGSNFSSGNLSYLNYAQKIQMTFNATISTVIITVLYPKLSKLFFENKLDNFSKLFAEVFEIAFVFISFLVVFLLIYSNEIISLIYERGAFSNDDTLLTAKIFLFFSVGILFFILRELILRIYLITGDSKKPLIISLFTILLNIFLSLKLVKNGGIEGLALANSVSMFISLLLMVYFIPMRRDILIHFSNFIKHSLLPVVIFSIVCLLLKSHDFFVSIDLPFGLIIVTVVYFILLSIFKNPSLAKIKKFVLGYVKK